MAALGAVLVAVCAAWLWVLIVTLRQARAMPPLALAVGPEAPDAPSVAVIVPARDEAHQLERCLRSLLAQQWPRERLRVVCVDDRSSDGTAELAERLARDDARLTVVRGAELPQGWLGKNHANAQGVRAAGPADFYLFTDADTVHAPQALATALGVARQHRAGLVSLFTDLEVVTFWERALLTNVIASILLLFPADRVNDPDSGTAVANGQFLLARREAYEAVGGHAAIRDRVADDLELARLFKRGGHGLRVENGRALVSVRMYRSLREIWWGFVKNASAGAGGPLVALLAAAWAAVAAAPFFALPWALWTGHPRLALLALCGVLLAYGQRLHVYRQIFAAPLRYALLLPVAQLMLAGIGVHSALRQLTGRGPLWKGRAYPQAR